MKYLDLFAGYGGFSLGIQRAYENISATKRKEQRWVAEHLSNYYQKPLLASQPLCVGFSEINKYAISAYKKHYPTHQNYGDITKINPEELPDFDLLVGGFPCQAFSIAGKRLGFDDTRGTLFFDVAKILEVKRPRLCLLENVKGLLSHDSGRTFRTILTTLVKLGYDIEWQVLNSKDFGVPQNRERVFIIGRLGGICGSQVFPIGEGNPNHLREITKEVSDAQRIYESKGLAKSQKALGGGLGAKTGLYAIPVITPDRIEKRQNGRRMKEDGEPMFTINTQDRHGIYDGQIIRRLTPTECERLMGLPDGWTAEGEDGKKLSDNQRYQLCGNGVVVNVVEEIIKKL